MSAVRLSRHGLFLLSHRRHALCLLGVSRQRLVLVHDTADASYACCAAEQTKTLVHTAPAASGGASMILGVTSPPQIPPQMGLHRFLRPHPAVPGWPYSNSSRYSAGWALATIRALGFSTTPAAPSWPQPAKSKAILLGAGSCLSQTPIASPDPPLPAAPGQPQLNVSFSSV